jgi:hypothetical protein
MQTIIKNVKLNGNQNKPIAEIKSNRWFGLDMINRPDWLLDAPFDPTKPTVAIYLRSSCGNVHNDFGSRFEQSNGVAQLQRICNTHRETLKNSNIILYRDISRKPSDGNQHQILTDDIDQGLIHAVFVTDVDRLSHHVQGVGKLWADYISRGVAIYTCHQTAPLASYDFISQVATHEQKYVKKVYSASTTRKQRLPTTKVTLGRTKKVLATVFHLIYAPLFKTERLLLSQGKTRKEAYETIALKFSTSKKLSFRGYKWTPRNVRAKLNDPDFRAFFEKHYPAKQPVNTQNNKSLSIMSSYSSHSPNFDVLSSSKQGISVFSCDLLKDRVINSSSP